MSLDPSIFSPTSRRPAVRFACSHLGRHPAATWGFAIVRTAYSPNEQWDTVLQTIKDAIFAEVDWEVKDVTNITMYMNISRKEKRRYWNAGPEGPFPPVDMRPLDFVKERLRLLVLDDDDAKKCADANTEADRVRALFKEWTRTQAEAAPENRLDTQVSLFAVLFVDEEAVDSVLHNGHKGLIGTVETYYLPDSRRGGRNHWPGWLRVQLSTLYSFYTSAASVEGLAQYGRKRGHTAAPVYDEGRDDSESEGLDDLDFDTV